MAYSAWNKGLKGIFKHTEKTKLEIRNSKLGDKNPAWKGNEVSYRGIHMWVRRNLIKPPVCSYCHLIKNLEVHNISGEYKRELSDWVWCCHDCHMIRDGRSDKWLKMNYKKKGVPLEDIHKQRISTGVLNSDKYKKGINKRDKKNKKQSDVQTNL